MNKIICIGGALIDETYSCLELPLPGTSNPSSYHRSAGGVSQNVAHHLAKLGNDVELITHLGNDSDGNWLSEHCKNAGISISHSVINNDPTGRYVAIIGPDGNLFTGAAAMNFESAITADFLKSKTDILKPASLIQTDCNLNSEAIEWIINFGREFGVPVVIEPVSVSKAKKLKSADLRDVLMLTPNIDELLSVSDIPGIQESINSILNRGVRYLWLRKGREGSELISRKETLFQPASEIEIVNVTGAGDAALAGWIFYFLEGKSIAECMNAGQAMAELVLSSKDGSINNLNSKLLKEKVELLNSIS